MIFQMKIQKSFEVFEVSATLGSCVMIISVRVNKNQKNGREHCWRGNNSLQ